MTEPQQQTIPTGGLATGETERDGAAQELKAIWKHRYVVFAITAAVTALTALATVRQPKVYSTSAQIEFDPNPARPLGSHVEEVSSDWDNFWSSREYYETQYHVIKSHHIADAVVRQLGLNHDPSFLGVSERNLTSFRSVTVIEAAEVLLSRMKVDPVKETRLVNISVEDTDPLRSQRLANTIASAYIRQNLEQRLSTTVSALEWLGQQLDMLRQQLESSEMALHEYRLRNNLLSISYEDSRNSVGNRIQTLATALTETLTHRISVTARVAELRRASAADDPLTVQAPELLASAPLQSLRGAYEGLRRERDGLATRYGPSAQQLLAVEGRMRELTDAIHHEVQNILGAAESELRQIHHVESDLRAAFAASQREALDLNLREIEYGRLQRERENNSKLYGLVLERTKETDLTRMQRVNNIRVLDDALRPVTPIKPRVYLNISIGALCGLLLGVMTAFLMVQSDRSVRSQQDVEDQLHTTFLGAILRVSGRASRGGYRYAYTYGDASAQKSEPITNPDLVVHTHPNSPHAEACRVIRTNLLFMSPDRPFQTLMVASADPREGKTTAAICMAITLAQSGKRVLLVDADLRRPRVHKAFGLRPPVGVTSVLVNESTLDDALFPTEVPNLTLLPCGPIPPNPSELLHSQRFHELIDTLRNKFDRVIFDTPPVGPVTDALIIASQVDGTVLVARARKTLRARAAATLGKIRALGGRVAGVVLNDVDPSRDTAGGYYYAGSYSYREKTQGEAA